MHAMLSHCGRALRYHNGLMTRLVERPRFCERWRPHSSSWRRGLLGGLLGVTDAGGASSDASSDWTVYHGNALGTGVSTALRSVDTTKRAWTSPVLNGKIYGEPLVYDGRVLRRNRKRLRLRALGDQRSRSCGVATWRARCRRRIFRAGISRPRLALLVRRSSTLRATRSTSSPTSSLVALLSTSS